MPHLAADGMLQIFGGLARGTLAQLDLSNVYLGGAQITGSAGSTIHDQASVLGKVHTGQLSTAAAVAAIGGIDAARDGMQGLMDGRFPGKMVIYPQVESFPLTALADLKAVAPEVYDLLGPRGAGREKPRPNSCGPTQAMRTTDLSFDTKTPRHNGMPYRPRKLRVFVPLC